MDVEYVVVFVTSKDKNEAKKISNTLLKKKLIACASIVNNVESCFWWQGEIDKAEEAVIILKSRRSYLPQIIKIVKSVHSYEVPEVIALPIVGGNEDYLNWIDSSLKP